MINAHPPSSIISIASSLELTRSLTLSNVSWWRGSWLVVPTVFQHQSSHKWLNSASLAKCHFYLISQYPPQIMLRTAHSTMSKRCSHWRQSESTRNPFPPQPNQKDSAGCSHENQTCNILHGNSVEKELVVMSTGCRTWWITEFSWN